MHSSVPLFKDLLAKSISCINSLILHAYAGPCRNFVCTLGSSCYEQYRTRQEVNCRCQGSGNLYWQGCTCIAVVVCVLAAAVPRRLKAIWHALWLQASTMSCSNDKATNLCYRLQTLQQSIQLFTFVGWTNLACTDDQVPLGGLATVPKSAMLELLLLLCQIGIQLKSMLTCCSCKTDGITLPGSASINPEQWLLHFAGQAVAYSNETREVATCGTGPKIEVWTTKPLCQMHEGILVDAAAAHRLTLQGHSADVTHVGCRPVFCLCNLILTSWKPQKVVHAAFFRTAAKAIPAEISSPCLTLR